MMTCSAVAAIGLGKAAALHSACGPSNRGFARKLGFVFGRVWETEINLSSIA